MRSLFLTFLVVNSFGCAKNILNEVPRRPNFDPPMTIEQFDVNQFDSEENQSETLSEAEENVVFENLLDTARLLYVNSNVKKSKEKSQLGTVSIHSKVSTGLNNTNYSFDEEASAKVLLQTSLKAEICDTQFSQTKNLLPSITTLLTTGASCPLLTNSQISRDIALGNDNISHGIKNGKLSINFRPDLLAEFGHKHIVGVEFNSAEKSVSQFFGKPINGFRFFRTQSANGSIKLADGQTLPYDHHMKSVFDYDQSQGSDDTRTRMVSVHQVKTMINGKAIFLTIKFNDQKEFEDSKAKFRCSINKKILNLKNCLILNSEFEHN